MIIRGDALRLPLRDDSVHLVIVDPPCEEIDCGQVRAEAERVCTGPVIVSPDVEHWNPGDGYGAAFYSVDVTRWITDTTAPGQVVLDSCCGIGTVPKVADQLGRIGVGVEFVPFRAERAAR